MICFSPFNGIEGMANDRDCTSPALGRVLTPRGVVFTGHLPSSGATDALVSIECTLQDASIGLTDLTLLGLVGGAGWKGKVFLAGKRWAQARAFYFNPLKPGHFCLANTYYHNTNHDHHHRNNNHHHHHNNNNNQNSGKAWLLPFRRGRVVRPSLRRRGPAILAGRHRVDLIGRPL